MATSSVSSSTTSSTASIDVAGMVAGLMAIENKPLSVLQSQIKNQSTKISDLGQLKGKVASFQTALKALESSASYTSAVANSSNSSAVTVSSSAGAIIGSHQIDVIQLAKPAEYIFSNFGFGSKDALVGFPVGTTEFDLTIGTGSPNTITVSHDTTIQELSDSINALGLSVSASITQTASAPNNFALIIQGTQSGVGNDFTFNSNASPGSQDPLTPSTANVSSQAQDAQFILDGGVGGVGGVSFTRASNSINDVLSGTTFNLVSSGSATITLAQGSDQGPTLIQDMISAFNDLVTTSKSFTQNASSDGSTAAGSLAGSLGDISFINQIKSMLATGAYYNNAGTSSPLGLIQLGIDINKDGTLQFNSTEYNSTENIASILASGINVGSTDFYSRTNNLNAFLTTEAQPFGILDKTVSNENNRLDQLNQKEQDLKAQLKTKQAAITAQYSSLNALLFTLNQTSNSLTSALAGLTTGQNNR